MAMMAAPRTSAAPAGSAAADGLTLVDAGKPAAVVVLPARDKRADQKTAGLAREEELAAQTLVLHVQQMSGATLKIVPEADLKGATIKDGRIVSPAGYQGPSTFILIGDSALTRQLGLSSEGLGVGGIILKTNPNSVALLGTPDGSKFGGGTAYATFTLLENLGVRYLWPGELGTVVPKRSTIVVAGTDLRFTPPIPQRNLRWMPTSSRRKQFAEGLEFLGATPEDYEKIYNEATATASPAHWMTWHRIGSNIGIKVGHAGYGLPEKGQTDQAWEMFGKEHPEWFALQPDGTRDQSRAGGRWRLCTSNPELIEHVANTIIRRVNEDPSLTCVPVAPNDGGLSNYCTCENCKKLDPPNAPPLKLKMFRKVGEPAFDEIDYVQFTDRHVHYWNALAERVTKVHPDLLLAIDAYAQYSTPPVREKLHPNLLVRYVPGTEEGWNGWRAAGAKRIFWRPNNLHSGYHDGIIYIYAPEMARTLRYLAENGCFAVDMQGIYNFWANMGLNYYVAARLSWDPSLTYEQILEDYCRSGFGAGGEHVRKYFVRAATLACKPVVGDNKFTPQAIQELRGHLEAAAAAATAARDEQAVLKRIQFLRAGMEYTALTMAAYDLKADPAKAGSAEVNELMQRRWNMMRAIFRHQNLAVNAPLVAGMDKPLRGALKWQGPPDQLRQKADDASEQLDWMYEDQTDPRYQGPVSKGGSTR